MGQIRLPAPVKLMCSIIAGSNALLAEARAFLIDRFGEIDFAGPVLSFDHTAYYAAEFGANLLRQIVTFERLIDPGTLADVKRATNDLETHWTREGKRGVNLDPGYVSLAKLVLATTKNHGHRIYLRDGIYAEVTLRFRDGAFRTWEWTYPDYALPSYLGMLGEIRERYRLQLRRQGSTGQPG